MNRRPLAWAALAAIAPTTSRALRLRIRTGRRNPRQVRMPAEGAHAMVRAPGAVGEAVMNIGDICKRKVITIGEHDELTRAAELMREHHIGYLVVVKPNIGDGTSAPVGVVTDRDIVVAVIARGTDPRSLRVGDVMARQPVVAEQDKPVSVALKDMRRIGVRRLPVVDHEGALVGILSVDDVLDALAGELWDVASSIRQEMRMEGVFRQ